jgi:hypothetical protein
MLTIPHRAIALAFRLILLAACGLGLSRILGLPGGGLRTTALVYFTAQANLAAWLLFLLLTLRTFRDILTQGLKGYTSVSPRLKGMVTLGLTITMLVYHVLLLPRRASSASRLLPTDTTDLLIHYVTPTLVLVDWLLFDPRGRVRWYDPLVWLAFPLAYYAFVLARARLNGPLADAGSRYVYFFLDAATYGWPAVRHNVLVLSAAITALGGGFWVLDGLLSRGGRRRASALPD